jgi:hypothetical protein
MTQEYIVERRVAPSDDNSWYQVMLSPFKTFEDCMAYIEKYSHYYPSEHQNYKITYNER